jgi:hypothetical protein
VHVGSSAKNKNSSWDGVSKLNFKTSKPYVGVGTSEWLRFPDGFAATDSPKPNFRALCSHELGGAVVEECLRFILYGNPQLWCHLASNW